MALLLKLKGWIEALGAIIVAVLGAFLVGKFKGSSAEKKTVEVDQAKETAQAIQKQTQTRQEVDSHVSDLPIPKPTVPPPITTPTTAQPIGNADPASAAGVLQKDWRET
jgi:type II secretory pathway pseudopilin PulG